jgi:TolB-like protein/DNA-binding winged helix-turn-helix (wHTH) protein
MEPVIRAPRVVRFGVFELDLRSGELRKQGRKIRLEGQPVQVLIYLLENPGELITREQLHRRLWPAATFVNFEHGLNAAIKRLRRALDDSADNPRFVETLPRRGYRFIAPVQGDAADQASSSAVEDQLEEHAPTEIAPEITNANGSTPKTAMRQGSRRTLGWTLSGVAVLLLAGGLILWRRSENRSTSVITSLAVLPLESLSGDASQEYFSDGMTDELITELGQIGGLQVISRTSIMTYKGTHKSLPQIARELNVDAVVEGTVLRSGQQVRITAQLIEAATDKHLWSQSYERDIADTLALQKEVARSIAGQIQIALTPREQAILKNSHRVNPEAYEAYLRGRYFWNKRTAEGFKKAIEYFTEATRRDPTYAPAYTGLADSYALSGDWEYGVLAPQEAYPKAKAAATRALALDDSLGEAHISLAFALQNFDWDWKDAGSEFRRGIELSPGYATGHQWYAWYLTAMQRNTEAIAEMKKAESLDPLSLIIGADLAEELLIAHRYDEAIKESQKIIEMDPRFAVAHYELGQAFVQKRLYAEAIAELLKAIESSGGSSTCTSNLAYAYAVSGRRDEAVRLLDDLKKRSNHGFSNAPEIALVYVGLNENERAMASLEHAYQERFNPTILFRPAFDALHSDSRFQDLMHRIGLTR